MQRQPERQVQTWTLEDHTLQQLRCTPMWTTHRFDPGVYTLYLGIRLVRRLGLSGTDVHATAVFDPHLADSGLFQR